jgi:PAS domain S-box-containing protein
VAILCYQGDRLAYVLGIPPDQIASYWPTTPFLVAILLLVPRRIWAVLIAAGLGAMALADLKDGVPIGFEIWFTLGNICDTFVAILGINLLFKGVPRLTSVKALAKYLVVGVLLAPLCSALVGAFGSEPGRYWVQWRLWFFADALAFLTLTPAILAWVREGRTWARKSQNYLELAGLMTLLVLFGSLTFLRAGRGEQPAMLYSLVPLLLWAALRLGLKGVSTSMVVVALLSSWGAAHGLSPFAQQGAFDTVLSMQLFLFFAAMPFMFLAVLVEEQKQAEGTLRKSEEKFSKAFRESPIALSLSSVKDHRYIEVNETFERRTGWSRDEVIGRTPLDIGLWTDFVQRDDFLSRLSNEGCVRNFEISARTKNGEVRTGLGSGELIEIDGQPCALTAVADITDLKRAEAALRQSEERLRLAIRAGKMYAFEWDAATDVIIRSEEVTHIPGLIGEPTRLNKQQLLASVHAEDRAMFNTSIAELTPESPNRQITFRLLCHNGSVRWLQTTGHAFFDEQGSMVRMIGVVADVTERKLAEEALSKVSGRLLEAQEQERLHLARELHDDISQKLVMLSVELHQFAQILPDSRARSGNRREQLFERISDISNSLHALSHRLHSSRLETLGLVAAMRGFCRELAEQREVKIDFTHNEIPKGLPPQTSLCLFRVLQEGLSNAVKHSGVGQFEVRLEGVSDHVELAIRDPGVGFDPGIAMHTDGLGLVSMRERISHVKGTISIVSKPMGGTEIRVCVPIGAGTNANQMSTSA